MADPTLAATISNVIAFPARNKGRKRKCNSPAAMGRCSFLLLERKGENIPANVTDVRSAREEAPVDESRIALRLALSLFAKLSHDDQKYIADTVRINGRHDDGQLGDECRILYRLLTGEQLPC